MNILDVHQYLAATFLPSISITDPLAATIVRAYATVPDANRGLTDLPCAMAVEHQLERTAFKPVWIQQDFAIRIDLFVKKSEVEQGQAAEIAAAFSNAIAFALSGDQRLGDTVSVIRGLRSDPMPLRLTWAGANYTGATLYLDVTLNTSKEHSA